MSHKRNRSSQKWLLGNDEIPECDTHSHLGILRSVLPSSVHRTTERCSSVQSAFFALNAVGSRFGCLHPYVLPLNYIPLSAFQLCYMDASCGH